MTAGELPAQAGFELRIEGWGVDNGGWAASAIGEVPSQLLQVEVGGTVTCRYPSESGPSCEVQTSRRFDVGRIFHRYPDSMESGFTVIAPIPANLRRFEHLLVRLIDSQGSARNIYSRCVELSQLAGVRELVEAPYDRGRCLDPDQG